MHYLKYSAYYEMVNVTTIIESIALLPTLTVSNILTRTYRFNTCIELKINELTSVAIIYLQFIERPELSCLTYLNDYMVEKFMKSQCFTHMV